MPFSPLLACAMTSISEEGAELLMNSSSVPDLFDLLCRPQPRVGVNALLLGAGATAVLSEYTS
jgi:hypothetical protein